MQGSSHDVPLPWDSNTEPNPNPKWGGSRATTGEGWSARSSKLEARSTSFPVVIT